MMLAAVMLVLCRFFQHLWTQIVHFHQSIARSVVHTTHDGSVIARLQRCNDRRLAWLSRSMPAVLDRADLISGDNAADHRSLPVVISSNQSPRAIVQL